MKDFSLHTPTQLFFGAGQGAEFAKAVAATGRKALLVMGGGSVRRLGYFDQVVGLLGENGVSVHAFSGIEPNPHAETINKATKELRTEGCDFVVALGGGSVMDASKAIAALAFAGEDDIWPFTLGGEKAGELKGALPIVAIPTTAATASEVTPYAVISHPPVNGKSVLGEEFLKPAVSWLNPEFTTSIGLETTRDGAADIMSHVFENYLLGGDGSPLADRHSEGVLATVMETLPLLIKDPENVDYRARLLWASNIALNGYQVAGREGSQFVLHSMEHALSGFYPELAHGRGLATLYPAYFRWLISEGRAISRLAQLGNRLFGLTEAGTSGALAFVAKFEEWLRENGLYQSLEDLGIKASDFRAIAEYAVSVYGDGKQLEALGPLSVDTIVGIYEATRAQSRAEPVSV